MPRPGTVPTVKKKDADEFRPDINKTTLHYLNDDDNDREKRDVAASKLQRNWRRFSRQREMEKVAKQETVLQDAENLCKTMCDAYIQYYNVPSQSDDLKPQFQLPTTIGELAASQILSTIVFMCVLLNGIQMGVQADHQSEDLNKVYHALDNIFTGVFAIEMVIKLAAWRFQYFKSSWNIFDFSLTWLSIIDVWIMSSLAGGGGGMKMFAVLRILRIFRVVRLLRMMKNLRELALIVQGFIEAMQTTGWVSLLLLLLLYIFSIFCVAEVGQPDIYPAYSEDSDEYEDVVSFNNYQYFGTIPRAMFTLLNLIMGADDWYIVGRALLEKQPMVLFVLIFFIMLTSIGLLNVIAGILVEHIMTSSDVMNKDDDTVRRKEMLERMEGLFSFVASLDQDGDCSIDQDELEIAWSRPEMEELKDLVNLPLGAEALDLSLLIDADGNGKLEMTEFVRALVRLLTNTSWQHILDVKCDVHRVLREVKQVKEILAPSAPHFSSENGEGTCMNEMQLLHAKMDRVITSIASQEDRFSNIEKQIQDLKQIDLVDI